MSAPNHFPIAGDLRRRLIACGVVILLSVAVPIALSSGSGAAPADTETATTVSTPLTSETTDLTPTSAPESTTVPPTTTSTTTSTTVPSPTTAPTEAPSSTTSTTERVAVSTTAPPVREQQVVRVGANGIGDSVTLPLVAPAGATLPRTGSSPLAPALTGIALLVAGALAASTRRRRQLGLIPIRVSARRRSAGPHG